MKANTITKVTKKILPVVLSLHAEPGTEDKEVADLPTAEGPHATVF